MGEKNKKMEAASKTENSAGLATQQLESESEKELRQHLENLKILKSDPLPENGVDEDDVDYDPGNDSSSDHDSDEDENESESTTEISELKLKHKRLVYYLSSSRSML